MTSTYFRTSSHESLLLQAVCLLINISRRIVSDNVVYWPIWSISNGPSTLYGCRRRGLMHLKRSCGIIINTTMSIWTTGWMCQKVVLPCRVWGGYKKQTIMQITKICVYTYIHVYPGNVLLLPRKFRKMSSIICNVTWQFAHYWGQHEI